uniref:Uncharacterized protein n=1 Tax=Kalanchoe fedtschenkoi TaxID=63787 RepID=A0A7N0VLW2_KALFE
MEKKTKKPIVTRAEPTPSNEFSASPIDAADLHRSSYAVNQRKFNESWLRIPSHV